MSDLLSRTQKLASAKKKLKKFQQTKSPTSTPIESHAIDAEILRGIQNNHIFKTPPISINKKDQPKDVFRDKNAPKKAIITSPPQVSKSIESPNEIITITNEKSSPEAEKLTDLPDNKSVEDLNKSLESYKRSNEQLTTQVNGQRKQIIQLQERFKKGSIPQLTEQRALKEQLEVHIQTIGILVSEKSELQASITAAQKRVAKKDAEVAQFNQRLESANKNFVEVEKRIVALQQSETQLKRTNKELVQERDRFSTRLYEVSHQREELLQERSEIQSKLEVKVEECLLLSTKVTELHARIQKGEILLQQLTTNAEDKDLLTSWQTEKENLLQSLAEQKNGVQKLIADKTELLEKYSDQQIQYDYQIEHLKNRINTLEGDNHTLVDKNSSLTLNLQSLQNQLDKHALTTAQQENVAAASSNKVNTEEFDQLQAEKDKVEKELGIQINESRRLSRQVFEQNEQIELLQSNLELLQSQSADKSSLLEQIQADKETISRALQQNKALKEQLQELEEGFVKVSNSSADLTGKLEAEQHGNKDVANKLSQVQVDMEETKLQLNKKTELCNELEEQVKRFREELHSAQLKFQEKEMDLDISNTELQTLKSDMQNDKQEKVTSIATDQLTEKLQAELDAAQEAVSNLSFENSHLQKALEEFQRVRNQEQEKVDEDLYPGGEIEEKNTSDLSWDDDDDDDNDEDYEQRYIPQPHQFSNSEVEDTKAQLDHLRNERLKIVQLLQQERSRTVQAEDSIEEHVQLRMQQRLVQTQRELQEHFYEQTEALRAKVASLQQALEIMRENEDISKLDSTSDSLTEPALKTAFMQLQKRYIATMEAKAQLMERIEQLEHINTQLESETETIGEYITLYQTQRQALKEKFAEKDRLIHHLSNEHSRMQNKVYQLHQLVNRVMAERTQMIESQNQPGHTLDEASTPSANHTPNQTTNGHTQEQILQIFEQLETTGEGYQHGWFSPSVRRHAFEPCKQCAGPMIEL